MSGTSDAGAELQALLAELEAALAAVEASADPDDAVAGLARMAELAGEIQGEIDRLRRETGDAAS